MNKPLRYHFVGIGGCGMSGLAQVLAQRGHFVCGSDMQSSAVVDRLGRRGIAVSIGHRSDGVGSNTDCVVVSAAVGDDNPEVLCARQNNIPVLKYAQLLGELSVQMETIAVAGTHGKSTTSGWLAYMLKQAGLDPSFVIGADVEQLGGGSGAGKGNHLVVEACEYDRSFLNLCPETAAILNIEADHLDYYRDIDDIIEAFGDFAGCVKPDGLIIADATDKNTKKALDSAKKQLTGPIEYFNVDGLADWQAEGLKYNKGRGCFDLMYRGKCLGQVALTLAGEHNVANALAVAAMGRHVGLSSELICQGLEKYVGVDRRMSYKGQVAGVVIMDDYAHHPTEIKATLAAMSALYQPRRIWCVFQPHQHSRTRFMLDDFAASFGQADIVLLPDIYFVRDSEQSRKEVNAGQLADKINARGGRADYLGDFESIIQQLCDELHEGDMVITMGAGNVWEVADELIRRLRRNR